MKRYEIWQDAVLRAGPVYIADTFRARFRGLMLRKSLIPGEGLLLRDCSAIHCCFMRFPIDVVYLDGDMNVVDVETVRPWRLGKCLRGVKHVLELEQGGAAELRPGMHLTMKESERLWGIRC